MHNGYQIQSCWFQIPPSFIPLSCLPGKHFCRGIIHYVARCYSEEVLLVWSSGERERQWHPRMELDVEPGQAWENSQAPPTRRRSACWSRGLRGSPSFHVISRHLNKVLLALQSIETERMVHWEFYLVSFTLCLMNSFIPSPTL